MALDRQTQVFIWGAIAVIALVVGLGAWKVVSRPNAAADLGPTVYAHVRARAKIENEQISFVLFSEIPEGLCESELDGIFERTLGEQRAWPTTIVRDQAECVESLPSRYDGMFENVTLSNPYTAFLEHTAQGSRETRIIVWGVQGEKAHHISRKLEADLEERLGVTAKTVTR
jgi:hypothetical protein